MPYLVAMALALSLGDTPTPAELGSQLREAGLDPEQCYHVRDLQFSRGGGRFFLTSGTLAFFRPVMGRRASAIFTAEIEGGDAEILVMPPTRGERASLAEHTGSPNLAERFRTALFLFTDDSAEEWLREINRNEFSRKVPDEAERLSPIWNAVLNNISAGFEVRLVDDLLSGRKGDDGFFFAALMGEKRGSFDFAYDPRARRQVSIGQLATRNQRIFYDVWSHFEAPDFRRGARQVPGKLARTTAYRIEAKLNETTLGLDVISQLSVEVDEAVPVLPFEISARMNVTAADVDGVPAQLLARDSLRAALLRGDQNETFLVVPRSPLAPGRHQITIRHEGDVISHAGNQVYFVASRMNWYPQHGTPFADFDLIFHYPRNLNLISSGELVEERTEGGFKISHRRSAHPLRHAGFNLGDYTRRSAVHGPCRVDVYANKQFETALQPQPILPLIPPPMPVPRRRQPVAPATLPAPPPIDYAPREQHLERMAREIGEECEQMSSWMGPPPQKTLSVSPIPGQFGQGFAGLIYLSTSAYASPQLSFEPRPGDRLSVDLLHTHETAHQWWGNTVTTPGYEDDWIQEGMANYLALLILEKRRGVKHLDAVLNRYRERLVSTDPNGRTLESAGPVTFGFRLQNPRGLSAWRSVVYDKGTWIMHMLRRRLGDSQFFAMLRECVQRFHGKPLSTEDLQKIAAEFLAKQPDSPEAYKRIDPKLDMFFEAWIENTGIPELKLQWDVKRGDVKKKPAGATVSVTITQRNVSDDFLDAVPVAFQMPRGKTLVRWVRTGSDPVTITQTLPAAPLRVLLDPENATLKR